MEKQYTVKEVAEILTKSVGTIRIYCKADTIKHTKLPGGGIRISESALQKYLGEEPTATEQEPKESEEVIKAKEATAIANANRERIEAEIAESEAQRRKEASQIGMTLEEYQAAQNGVNRLAEGVIAKEEELRIREQDLIQSQAEVLKNKRDNEKFMEWYNKEGKTQVEMREILKILGKLFKVVNIYPPATDAKYAILLGVVERYKAIIATTTSVEDLLGLGR